MATSGGSSAVAPAAADILDGFLSLTATTGAATIVTVPAGRTWVGNIAITVATTVTAAVAATGATTGVVSTAGVGVTPAAGIWFICAAQAAANVVAGLTGTDDSNSLSSPFVVVAPAGNAVTIAFAATVTGSSGQATCSAIGVLQ